MRAHTPRRRSAPGLETHAQADLVVRCHFLPESRQTVAQPVQFQSSRLDQSSVSGQLRSRHRRSAPRQTRILCYFLTPPCPFVTSPLLRHPPVRTRMASDDVRDPPTSVAAGGDSFTPAQLAIIQQMIASARSSSTKSTTEGSSGRTDSHDDSDQADGGELANVPVRR